ncbi:MAG TPA: tRNA (adenosine(37)-N6)-dimethylallyltransferase MiaA [Gammaproteobacteria bacterium]|nr:tRNA (adenosine(37)-N6)-dimethylallyltransferase MiaA [Gammaproteobacteria bacterium]
MLDKSAGDSPSRPVVVLMGPTASGKTELAIELQQYLPLDIISVDSVMVYRGMDIGSAKPDAETLLRAPHRLIDIRDPAEVYSAAEFCVDARREIQAVHAAGRIPLLTGGTMLYFRALLYGLSELPTADAATRKKLEAEADRIGWAGMHQRLSEIDPRAAQRIHPNDPQRIQRALEVYELTGLPLSSLQQQDRNRLVLPWPVIKLAVVPTERSLLHQRIEWRFQQMMEQGLIAEVEALMRRGDLNSSMPSVRAVGYRQVWELLSGRMDYTQAIEKGIIATRQLAKRQFTWLRSETDLHCFDSLSPDLGNKVLDFLDAAIRKE